MPLPLTIKKGDTGPAFRGRCVESDGSYANLTGASAKLRVRHSDGSLKVSDQALTVTDAPNGEVLRAWQTAETSAVGSMQAEVHVTFPDGREQTYPSRGNIPVYVYDRV